METFLTTLHYLLCFFLIVVILLQSGKGADIGAAFGGASQTVFGGRGPVTFLNKLTAIVAISFLVTSIWLAQISKTMTAGTVFDKTIATEQLPAAGTEAAKEEAGAAKAVEGETNTPVEK